MPKESAGVDRGRRVFLTALYLVLAWMATVLTLGFVGYSRIPIDPHAAIAGPVGKEHLSVYDRIYFSLQLLYLHAPESPSDWEIQTARFLAPSGEIFGLVLGIVAVTITWLDRIRRYTLGWRHHVVICGLGRKGLELARDLRHQGRTVLVIEKDRNNPFIELCDQIGAIVLIGDATKIETLRKAYLQKADYLIAACGSDGTNVDIAIGASRVHPSKNNSPDARPKEPATLVHIVDTGLRELVRQQKLLAAPQYAADITIFNIFENSSRLLFRTHYLDYTTPITEENDPREPHLVVFGFGQMGESVVLQAVKMAHFPTDKKLRITVIDHDARNKHERFLIRYDAFPRLCKANFIESVAENHAILEQARKWCESPDSLTTFVVAFDSDSHSMSFAVALWNFLKLYHCPIYVRVSSNAGLSQLLTEVKDGANLQTPIQGFGRIEEASSSELVVREQLNRFAKSIHEDYKAKRVAEGRNPNDPSLKDWNDLDQDLKESNWQQAEHIPFKLRALGFQGNFHELARQSAAVRAKLTTSDGQDSPEVLKLAKMEHRRWVAERSLAGWKLSDKKDVVLRTHPDLVPWAELPASVQQYDKDAVKHIPGLLDLYLRFYGS